MKECGEKLKPDGAKCDRESGHDSPHSWETDAHFTERRIIPLLIEIRDLLKPLK